MDRARVLGNAIAALNPNLARTNTTAIFINHIRDVIDTSPTRPGMPRRTTTPGGTSLKFYASVRVEFAVVKTIKHDRYDVLTGETISEPHAVLVRVKVTKNKLAPPFQSADLCLELGKGFSNPYSAANILIGNKVIRKSGSYLTFPEDLYHPQMSSGSKGPQMQGVQSALDLAEHDPDWGEKLVAAAQRVLDDARGRAAEVVVTEAVDLLTSKDPVEPTERPAAVPSVEDPSGTTPSPVFVAQRGSGGGVRFVGEPGAARVG